MPRTLWLPFAKYCPTYYMYTLQPTGSLSHPHHKCNTAKSVVRWVICMCSPKAHSKLGECLFAEHTSDSLTNYDLFLKWTISSPNMVQTVWQTLFHSQLACNEMQALAWTCSRQHDRKCRLKSSQVKSIYTLIIPHRVIQLTTISFWVPETRLSLPQVNK